MTAPNGRAVPWSGVLVIWLVTSLAMLGILWGRLDVASFSDADDALRLQQVRDWLAGQSWFDVTQYRVAPPAGVPMHWTRIVDLPIAALIVMLRPLLGTAQAEVIASIAVPLLTLLATMMLAANLAARRFGPQAGLVAALLVTFALPVSIRMMPLRIDHHAWQYFLALAAFGSITGGRPGRGGALAGLALAASLAISLEALPLAMVFAGVCTLRLWRGDGRWLGAFMAGLALGAVALFLGTRGLNDLADHCDALSPVHLAVLLWAAAGCALVLPRLRRHPPMLSLLVLGLFGAGAAAIMGLRAPQCLGADAFAALDPIVRSVWLDAITEGLPVWRQSAAVAFTALLPPLLGLIACWRLWRRAPDAVARQEMIDMALLLAGATLIGTLVLRVSGVACLFAAVPAAWQVQEQLARWSAERLLLRRMLRVPLIVGLLMPWAYAIAPYAVTRPSPPARDKAPIPCNFRALAPTMAAMPRTTVLAGLDLGPALLATSPHNVVATGHHRGNAAMRDLIIAFLGPDHGARRIMQKYGATLVLTCPAGRETQRYIKMAPDGFMAHLAQDKAPQWLVPVDVPPASGIRVWRLR